MSFVMLLLLSLTSLVRVGSEASVRQVDVLKARQNALLSMQVALGKLQQYAGQDQRVTALSGSLQGGPVSDGGTIQTGSQYWLGVWDADKDSDTYGQQLGIGGEAPSPEWLLSGGLDLDPVSDDPLSASGVDATGAIPRANAADYALLVGPGDLQGSAGSAVVENFVVAPVESIDSDGGMAWWVSDEGQKAKIIADRHEENYENLSNKEANTLKLIAPQRNGLEAIQGLLAFERGSGIGLNEISKMSTFGDAAFLGAGETLLLDSVKNNYHALSLHSQGVIANVAEGGLKKDLSHEFHPKVSNDNLQGEQIFGQLARRDRNRKARVTSRDDPGGPFWDQIRSYANTEPTGGVINFQPHKDKQYGVMPIITQVKVYYHAYWTEYSDGTIGIRFVILPHLVMNNPYPYSLNMPDTYFQVLHGPTSNYGGDNRDPGFHVFAYNFDNFVDPPYSSPASGSTITALTTFSGHPNGLPIGMNNRGHEPRYLTYGIAGYTFPPGATRVFSPSEGLVELDRNSGENMLEEGDRGGSGFYIDVPNSRFSVADLEAVPGGNPLSNLPDLQIQGYHSNDIHLVFGLGSRSEGSGTVITEPFKVIYRLGAWGLGTQFNPRPHSDRFFTLRSEGDTSPLQTDESTPIFGFDHSLRLNQNYLDTAQFAEEVAGTTQKIPWLAHYNPAANLSMRSPYDWPGPNSQSDQFLGGFANNPNYLGGCLKHSDDYPVNGFDSPYFGVADNTGGNQVILFDLPTEDAPLTSIGQLMHANPSRNFDFDLGAIVDRKPDGEFLDDMLDRFYFDEFYFGGNIQPTYAIGNSLANGKIPSGSDGNRDGVSDRYLSWRQKFPSPDWNRVYRRGVHYDYSYLLNEALWDKYFFSAIDFDQGDVVDRFPHANSRMLLHGKPTSTDFTDDGYNNAAAHLILDGAFNINSTSKEAWKAILASFMNVGNSREGGVSMEANLQRMIEPLGSAFFTGDTNTTPNSYTGFRRLNLVEIDQLAEEIVTEIRKRMSAQGSEADRPFLSLAEFINRSANAKLQGVEKEMQLKGALQAAIDNSELNDSMDFPRLMESQTRAPREELHADDYLSRNITTYLSQADLLARLGSVLSARSDTFLIRSYGDVRDPISGEISSKAWCEAVIQRMPEYVSEADQPDVLPDELTDEDNRLWGRRCHVVSVRWLTTDDLYN
ncbi:MAG: hypothetical protein ACON46_07740 [Coraliomargaritaceae bacterium]